MSLQLVITNAGRAALVAAGVAGTNAVRIASCGISATAIVAAPTTAALPGEIKRIASLSGTAISADTIHMIVRDETTDEYQVKSLAFYLTDGTLFACYGQPTLLLEKSAASFMLCAADVQFQDIAAANITFGNANFLNPPATTDTAGVVQLATDAEAMALLNALKALTPHGLAQVFTAANILSRLITVDGSGSGLDADLLDGRHAAEFGLLAASNVWTVSQRINGGLGVGYTEAGNGNVTAANRVTALGGDVSTGNGAGSTPGVFWRGDNTFDAILLGSGENLTFRRNSVSLMTLNSGALNVVVSLTRAGNTVWDAANDGSGSGLDADLLDGQHGSYYADITARLGYTPLNSTTYSAANVLAKLVTVDGSGSGLDADLLDGYEAAALAKLAGAAFTGAVTVSNAGGIVSFSGGDVTAARTASTGVVYLGSNGVHYLQFDGSAYQLAGAQLYVNGSVSWNAANDGSGSGLDADLLDGYHASAFGLLAAINNWLTHQQISGGLGIGMAETTAGRMSATGRIWSQGGDLSTGNGAGTTPGVFWRGANTFDISLLGGGEDLTFRRNSAALMTLNSVALNLAIALTRGGNTVWDAANDGSGSGLDADLLDGYHASSFALQSAFANSIGANGYQKLPGGLILQWATGLTNTAHSETTALVNFPLVFPHACLGVSASTQIANSSNSADAMFQVISYDTTGTWLMREQFSNVASDATDSAPFIFAIGW